MARAKRPTGDVATVARKRFYRSAERYLKQAAKSTGATAARLKSLAKREFENALSTYSKKTKQKFSKPIQRIASALGINLEQKREELQNLSDTKAEQRRKRAIDLTGKSERSLVGTQTDSEQLRQEEAKKIFGSSIGSRIIGGLVDVWLDEATEYVEDWDKYGNKYIKTVVNRPAMFKAMFEYFKVDNLADLLDAVEDIVGEILYSEGDEDTIYETVKLTLQTHILNELVA